MIVFRENKPRVGQEEIVGHIEFHHEFYSINLKNERDIIVWLPPSYQNSTKMYPVLYVHDGQNLFSPHTSYIGHDWRIDEVLTELIKEKKVEEIIVVGIYNNKDRLEEYNYFTFKGKKYIQFIIKELKPFIDKNYKTKSDKKNTAVMGSSMGGLISFQMAWHYPRIFGKAACMSNSLWTDNRKIFETVTNDNRNHSEQKIYLDCGCDEKQLIRDNKEMCLLLRKKGFVNRKNLFCYFVKGGKHSEIDWSHRIDVPLEFLFGIK
jgi:predicted alpha/beta superfamily hydrolase